MVHRPGGDRRTGWRRALPRRRLGWLWVMVTLGIAGNTMRLRQRLSGLRRLPPQGAAGTGGADPGADRADRADFVLLAAPGVIVDDETRRKAITYARAEGLDVLDLVPGDLPVDQVLDLARAVDTTTFRSAPLVPGRGASHALLVSRQVWLRAEPPDPSGNWSSPEPRLDRTAFIRLTERLKQHAARTTDLAVAPELHAVGWSLDERLGQLDVLYGGARPVAVFIPAARSVLLGAGVVVSPGWGAAAALAAALQPYLVVAGGLLASRPSPRRFLGAAARSLVEPFRVARAARAARRSGIEVDPVESRRPVYATLLENGVDGFFEPRRDTCPWCGGRDLTEQIRMPDWTQFKPGEFVLDRCRSCGHVFQNPRLTLSGLDFYYRDMYDGLGGRNVEFLFASAGKSYKGRVDMVQRHVQPATWLDVGTGYGHFCLVAKATLPDTRFDGLDLGESILEAARRGWVDHAYRGLFPDMADELAGCYDVVSMHHYLEHTIDPAAELAAAARVLPPGGHLLIEVPDPDSRFARLLGRAWLSYLQPQHLHFLTLSNLEVALQAHGFTVVDTERGPAHQPTDLAGGILMRANAAAPPRAPWRVPPTGIDRARRVAVLAAAAPFVALAMVADRLLQPVVQTKAQSWSNTYRVLARRTAAPDAGPAADAGAAPPQTQAQTQARPPPPQQARPPLKTQA